MSDNRWEDVCDRVDACALTGAAAFCAGIPEADILANGPMWCYFYALRHLEHADYNMAQRFHGSQPDNNAIVYGTEEYLTKALQRLLANGRRPKLLLIENSCSLSLIGDDISGIARKMELPFPFVAMDCGGLIGGFAEGYGKACLKIVEELSEKEPTARSNTINLLGLTDFYYNGMADRQEICRILEKAGYVINCVPGGGSSVESIRQIGAAGLNIVCHEELGRGIAKFLQERYGTEFIAAGLPYGIEGTKKWLMKIHEKMPAKNLTAVFQECDEEQQYLASWNNDIRGTWGSMWFDNAMVAAPGTTALYFAESLRGEWLDTGQLTVICRHKIDRVEDYCSTADKILAPGEDHEAMSRCLRECGDVLLAASSSEASIMRRRGRGDFAVFTLAFPAKESALLIKYPFMGIKGSGHVQQLLWNLFIQDALVKGRT